MSTSPLRTPLYENHVVANGRLVEFAGWSMPVQYTSIVEEHQAVRKAFGVFDISHMARLHVRGPDAALFLDHVFTRRVIGMKPGQIRYGLVCHQHGGILDDVLVYRLADEDATADGASHRVVVNASNREKIVNWFDKHSSIYDITIEDATRITAMIAVQGPRAIAIVDPLTDVDVPAMRYYTGQAANVAGHSCYVSRTGYTGEDGYEFIVPAASAAAVWDIILGAGQTAGAKPAGLGARDTLRLEAAMPLYGHELSETINPVQAGLDFAIQLKDRDFIGRDAIVRIKKDAVQPVRVGLELDGKRVAREGAAVLRDGEQVGKVTSGTFSPTFERPIAMAYISQNVASDKAFAPGQQQKRLDIDIRGKPTPARLVELPFYTRAK